MVRSTATRPLIMRGACKGAAAMLCALAVLLCGSLAVTPAAAQSDFLAFPPRPRPPAPPPPPPGAQPQMLVQATEVQFDYTNQRVIAFGNVQIYYSGSTVEADKVIYDQKTKKLHAEGNVRLTEPDGKITYGEIMNLTDDYRDGFVDSLRLDTPDQTRFAATRATRSEGNFTVFQNGVYTACEACKDDPRKPPLWQVKSARIIHDEGEKMVYFEQARLEFFGVPLMYMPYFSAPDPTVKRKTGFLMPVFSSSSKYGVGVEIPYFWALAPDYDFTFNPTITSRQGPLLQGEWRQRLVNGSYYIRGAGIYQLDKDVFKRSDGTTTPGYRNLRGSVESSGMFALAPTISKTSPWVAGWDIVAPTDKTFYQDYGLRKYFDTTTDPLKSSPTEGISQAYITGRGARSFFDARSIYYYGFSEADNQKQIPIIHPVMDFMHTFENRIFGGELGVQFNLTSLSRKEASFDPITQTAVLNGTCAALTADPAQKTPTNCLLRGIPGTYTRFSAETHWKRTFTDPIGQMFTPFFSIRADAAMVSVQNEPGVSNFIAPGDSTLFRTMPTVGLEYRYPFIAVHSWGTQTVEPIAQLIFRPNETSIGKIPNEDAQSLIFDDSNLFRVDKFSGWDRVEGGGRANVGMQYSAQFNRGGFVNVLFGQSYQLFGVNSYAVGDITNTGLNSGLDTANSDYVARLSYQPDKVYTFTSRFRFDQSTFNVSRFEIEGRANYGRVSLSVLYGNYAAQPLIGFLNRREGILGTTTIKLTPNWALLLAARYDIEHEKFNQTRIGLGYIDDCLILGLNYITDYTYSGNATIDHRVLFQLSLRTLGGTSVTQTVGGIGGGL